MSTKTERMKAVKKAKRDQNVTSHNDTLATTRPFVVVHLQLLDGWLNGLYFAIRQCRGVVSKGWR